MLVKYSAKSIRAFIGAKNYEESRAFYRELGFEEIVIGDDMCFFKVNEKLGFYLQDYYVKKWIDNSMLFLEVEDLDEFENRLLLLDLPRKFGRVRISGIREESWGRELFVHDPSGVLWHFGEFKS